MSNRTHALSRQKSAQNLARAQSEAIISLRDRIHVLEQLTRNLERRIKAFEDPAGQDPRNADAEPA